MVRAAAIAGFVLTLAAACLAQQQNGDKLGTVQFATSCNELAQKKDCQCKNGSGKDRHHYYSITTEPG